MNPTSVEARRQPKNNGNLNSKKIGEPIKPYPMSVANNLPIMLRELCFYWLLITIFTVITVQGLPEDKESLEAIELN